MCYYRITVDGVGIYEAVERDCPRDDDRRKVKPDGSWLPKVGMNYPGAVSYWTEAGFERYKTSGLFNWHSSVVRGAVKVDVLERKPASVLYEDELQIIVQQ